MNTEPRTLVVIATYNEIDNLPRLTDEVLQHAPQSHVLVIDDGSPDGTGQWCDERAAQDDRFHVIHRASKLGLGTATVAGLRYAIEHGFDYALVMDADFSHPPRYIPSLLAGMARDARGDGADVMVGSRYVPGGRIEGWPWYRHWMSRGVNRYARWMLGLRTRDCSGAFRCYRTEQLRQIDLSQLRSRGYSYVEELLWMLKRSGARIGETPIVFVDRQLGRTKINGREAVAALWILFRLGIRNYLGL
ncbi:MAG: polyprenol monophosphomannose synthase [Pirellulaceae bacterium]|jgi:dolichol-phosphate mannosyltransferase|nr:polyprenol monophosphomannose synthase [Pirellulaceae bacterium]